MDLQYTVINNRKIIALPFILEALTMAHQELISLGIGMGGMMGFVSSEVVTASWRSLALQTQLVAKGASKTLSSNHRRGTAVDCFPDEKYIEAIIPTMKKYGLVNDLAPWDKDHFQWQSNGIAMTFPIFNQLPTLLKEFSMDQYDNHSIQLTEPNVTDSGSYALVFGGKKHLVTKDRAGFAAMTILTRGMVSATVNKATWDSIPSGDNF